MRSATLLTMLALARQPLAARCWTQQAVARVGNACTRLYCTSQAVGEASDNIQQQQQEHHSRLPPEQVSALQAAKEVYTNISCSNVCTAACARNVHQLWSTNARFR
jgi:hypothetical protein